MDEKIIKKIKIIPKEIPIIWVNVIESFS